MKSAGIIAEFNPFHNGHEYIISETRRLTGCESVCIAMSGNYVQRGEPAILDKWIRAEIALKAGADLVIEIPTLFCLGNASQYARAGVRLIEAMGMNLAICCGSESAQSKLIERLAKLIKDKINIIDELITAAIKKGHSYPAAREQAILEIITDEGASFQERLRVSEILSNPNDNLALEYMLWADKSEVICIKRIGASHDANICAYTEYQSAGTIRKLLAAEPSCKSLEMIKSYVPACSYEALSNNKLIFTDDWTDILRYAVMQKDAYEIEDAPSAGEGLGYLLKDAALKFREWNDILMHCKSKRYTYTRISRLLMQAVLGISRSEYDYSEPLFIRVLGFNSNGRALLSEIKRKAKAHLPIITNINREKEELNSDALKMLELDIKSTDVYNLILGRDIEKYSEHKRGPIII